MDVADRTLTNEGAFRVDASAVARVVNAFIHILADVVDKLVAERAQTAVRSGRVDAFDWTRIR